MENAMLVGIFQAVADFADNAASFNRIDFFSV